MKASSIIKNLGVVAGLAIALGINRNTAAFAEQRKILNIVVSTKDVKEKGKAAKEYETSIREFVANLPSYVKDKSREDVLTYLKVIGTFDRAAFRERDAVMAKVYDSLISAIPLTEVGFYFTALAKLFKTHHINNPFGGGEGGDEWDGKVALIEDYFDLNVFSEESEPGVIVNNELGEIMDDHTLNSKVNILQIHRGIHQNHASGSLELLRGNITTYPTLIYDNDFRLSDANLFDPEVGQNIRDAITAEVQMAPEVQLSMNAYLPDSSIPNRVHFTIRVTDPGQTGPDIFVAQIVRHGPLNFFEPHEPLSFLRNWFLAGLGYLDEDPNTLMLSSGVNIVPIQLPRNQTYSEIQRDEFVSFGNYEISVANLAQLQIIAWAQDRNSGRVVQSVSTNVSPEVEACHYPRGDMNFDCRFNNFDIDPFVEALMDFQAWLGRHPDHANDYLSVSDLDCDGAFTNFEIEPFLAGLVNYEVPAC